MKAAEGGQRLCHTTCFLKDAISRLKDKHIAMESVSFIKLVGVHIVDSSNED